ncbi:hypothetical protein MSAN_02433800 [Mycena sanguinolenta]|uniref:VIT domain-containing protein n=1 Tax=Mycena sanguinolenta TaxID=230812 RepID=A0A8H7CCJ9_9AGAR|nr:hypothetical protein MSAN_02433800 [Mycena sanguinolenta]
MSLDHAIPIYGLHYRHKKPVPLLRVHAEATIKELAAQVKLTQTYNNDSWFSIEATYTFPIPARATVCSFVMIKQDGTRVVGSVAEKQDARETYMTAVARGQQASLMEQHSPDVFQLAVGNIPSKHEFISALDMGNPVHPSGVFLSFPQHLRPPFLTLAMSVETIAPISNIGCPSHPVLVKLGPDPNLPNFKDLPFSNYARVSLSSDSPLDKDFVLTLKSAGLDAPRCVAELHPTDKTEFVFMVDRSGSMKGMRIEAAKKSARYHAARISSLWPEGSQPYNQATLEEATRHIDTMTANYSGTEIRAALKHVFVKQRLDRPMNVLMLTDGDAWDLNGVLSEVKLAVSLAPKDAYVRVSVLGIGNSASTAMCEGIARVGNGTCMMVGEDESTFTGKIARMLKAAKTPPIADLTIDWGTVLQRSPLTPRRSTTISRSSKNTLQKLIQHRRPPPPEVILPAVSPVQQAPFQIQNLFPSIRLNAYAILQGETIPKTVIIRGSTADGAKIELSIPVVLSQLENVSGAPSALHALAARKIIQDLEDGKHALAKTISNPDDEDLLARTVKASIIQLGKTYSIASTHTSFVAVDDSQPGVLPLSILHVPGDFDTGVQAFLTSRPKPGAVSAKIDPVGAPIALSVGAAASSSGLDDAAIEFMFNTIKAPLASNNSRRTRRGRRGSKPKQSFEDSLDTAVGSVVDDTAASNLSSGETFNAMMSVPAAGPAAATSHCAILEQELAYLALLESELPDDKARGQTTSDASRKEDVRATMSPLIRAPVVLSSDPLESLARMQSFDGCFSLEVLRVITLKTDIEAVRSAFPAGATDGMVATVLAMVFLSTKLGAGVEREAWEGIYEKAQQYVVDALQRIGAAKTVEALEAEVEFLI